MIGILDYGVGNLRSVEKAFEHIGCEAVVSADISVLEKADGLVLPGVGAFEDGIKKLKEKKFDEFIKNWVAAGNPILGICLGMQLLFEYSFETNCNIVSADGGDAVAKGLGIIPGGVKKFESDEMKIPQMGWNEINIRPDSSLFKGIENKSYMYFVHSYYCCPEDEAYVATWTDYIVNYCSSVEMGNVFATQFHPEKSGRVGLQILKNFADLSRVGGGAC